MSDRGILVKSLILSGVLQRLHYGRYFREGSYCVIRRDLGVFFRTGHSDPDGSDAGITCSGNIPFQTITNHKGFISRHTQLVEKAVKDFRFRLADAMFSGDGDCLEERLKSGCGDLFPLQIRSTVGQEGEAVRG